MSHSSFILSSKYFFIFIFFYIFLVLVPSNHNVFSFSNCSEVNCSVDSYNCNDFTYQEEATFVLNCCGGPSNDVHDLDRDGDGTGCDTLPSNQQTVPEPSPTAVPTNLDGQNNEAASAIHRFWSDKKQGHFYTISEEEKNHIINTYDDIIWRYEGTAYYAYSYQAPGTTPVYRFWSDQKQGHFYTISSEEKDYVIETYDDSVWRYEGIGYYVYPLSYTGTASTVYRFWSDQKQKHFYTASEAEKDYVIDTYDDTVWRYEGEAWKVLMD